MERRAVGPGQSGKQKEIDFERGTQLKTLRHCRPPKMMAKDGSAVAPRTLKDVLKVIDDHGRYCSISFKTMAQEAEISLRQAKRAVEVLREASLLVVSRKKTAAGWFRNEYRIVWTELDLLCPQEGELDGESSAESGGDLDGGVSAVVTKLGAVVTNPSAVVTNLGAVYGTLSVSEAPHEAPSEASGGSPRAADDDEDGARYFFDEEETAIRAKANRINSHFPCRDLADRQFVLKVATLWHDRRLAEDWVEQAIESLQAKRAKRETVDRPMGWLWETLRDKCRQAGLSFDRLVATTEFPQELLAPPAERSVA